MITFDDFTKIEIKVGTIIEASYIEGSDKLFKLKVNFGIDDDRQVISGIAKFYKPEDIINTQKIFITNLEPRLIMGLISQAMILAAKDENTLTLFNPDKIINSGTKLS